MNSVKTLSVSVVYRSICKRKSERRQKMKFEVDKFNRIRHAEYRSDEAIWPLINPNQDKGSLQMPNDNSIALTMDQLHEATSAEVNSAMSAETRVATGTYLGKTNAVFAKHMADDAEYDAGRNLASLAMDLYDFDATTKLGKLFLKVSWEPRYNKAGKLDNPSRRYAELSKALNLRSSSPGEVFDVSKQQMVSIKVRETFKVAEGDLHDFHSNATVGADGEAWVVVPIGEEGIYQHYSDLGYAPKIMVDRVFKAV